MITTLKTHFSSLQARLFHAIQAFLELKRAFQQKRHVPFHAIATQATKHPELCLPALKFFLIKI